MKNRVEFLTLLLLMIVSFVMGQTQDDEKYMLKYISDDGSANTDYHDGKIRPAVGTKNYQIMRANRTYPYLAEGLGWTYNHAPNLAYWNDHFVVHYLSNPMGEHKTPGVTLIATSENGINWETPRVVFPVYTLVDNTDRKMKITTDFMHQRMGFYVAPNGRLLAMGFYGENDGDGIGRVVREIYEDFSFGPVYFIRVNDNWEGEVHFPLYHESDDRDFVEACESFMADKIRRIQWWEENFKAADADTFYMPHDMEKAFNFYTISDSLTIGLFKHRRMTYTLDGGETWAKPFKTPSLLHGGAKIWGKKLDNGQFAIVYNPTGNSDRHPLSVAVSDDGINFDNLAVVHGEVPVKRFWGWEKRPGPQYVRGIVEGNGNPPDDDLWVVYSVNKEDLWISRIPVPITRTVEGPVKDEFSSMQTGGVVDNWNIYSPKWCPVKIVNFPDEQNKSLMLKDFDLYDYAKATRVFGQAPQQQLSFEVFIESNTENFYVDITNDKGIRLIQTVIDIDGVVHSTKGSELSEHANKISSGKWMKLTFDINSDDSMYNLYIDDNLHARGSAFNESGSAERIIFRTGEYRLNDKVTEYKSGNKYRVGFDEPGADEMVDEAAFYIRNFSTNIK